MFTSIAKLASIQTVLALAAANDMELHQIDIKGAYLNGELTAGETIYMAQPPGYHAPNSSRKVCHLITLYGLKQCWKCWYQKLVEIMTHHLQFARCDIDQAVFFRCNGHELVTVLVHVDDCTIAALSIQLINDFKAKISKHVGITNLGKLHWLLGMEVICNQDQHTIHLSQEYYIISILHWFNFDELKPTSTPMQTRLILSMSQIPKTMAKWAQMCDMPYCEAVRLLMYVALGICPDITYGIKTLSHYSTKLGPTHWEAVKRVFCYLSGTKGLWLTYG